VEGINECPHVVHFNIVYVATVS